MSVFRRMMRPILSPMPYAVYYCANVTDATGLTTYTFNNVQFGRASAKREIFVVAICNTAVARTLSSGTIGGITATVGTNQYGGAASNHAVMFASVPQGNAGTIALTFSGACSSCIIGVFAVYNRPGSGTNETDSDTNTGAATTSSAISTTTISAKGFILGICNHLNAAVTALSEGRIDDDVTFTTTFAFSSYPIQPVSFTPTMTWSWSGNANVRSSSWAFA